MSALIQLVLAAELATATPDCGATTNAAVIAKTESLVRKKTEVQFNSESLRDSTAACVRVEFSIDTNGHADGIKIVETSGERALDKAAVEALKDYCFEKPGKDAPHHFSLVFHPPALPKTTGK